jgi:hypothetical protein
MIDQNKRKPFESRLCLDNDMPTKTLVVDFLIAMGLELRVPLHEQPEVYTDWDMELYWKGKPKRFEVERKLSWNHSHKWQGFDTVDVAYRKCDSKADYFIMVNKHFNTLCVAPMDMVQGSVVGKKKTIYTPSGNEQFYRCNLDIFTFYSILETPYGNWWREFKPWCGTPVWE